MTETTADIFGEEFAEEEISELEHNFNRAAAVVQKIAGSAQSSDLLYLYARYKQATEGVCNTAKPSFFDLKAKQKWQAWKALEDMSKDDAMKEYIECVRRLEPDFEAERLRRKSTVMECDDDDDSTATKGGAVASATNGKGAFGLSVSVLQRAEREISEEEKTVFDWAREGRADRVSAYLRVNPDSVNAADVQGLTLLHWACDRGFTPIVKMLLVDYKASVTVVDASFQTPLHYAASCGYADIVRLLLEHDADKSAQDDTGSTCVDVAIDDNIRRLLDES